MNHVIYGSVNAFFFGVIITVGHIQNTLFKSKGLFISNKVYVNTEAYIRGDLFMYRLLATVS